jgi:carbon-monoxide dehydrogenase medium subunit
MKFPAFDYLRPTDLQEALDAISDGKSQILAGGQSLSPMMGFRMARPTRLVDIARIPALRAVSVECDGALRIGAAVTHSMIEDGALPDPWGAFMARAAANIAYRAVRNRGTIAGSIAQADPAADWPCILRALDASVILRRSGGERVVALAGFLIAPLQTDLAPGEMIVALQVPPFGAARHGLSKSNRKAGEYAEALAVARLLPRSATLCFGALEGPPRTAAVDPTIPSPPARLAGSPLYVAVDAALRATGATDPEGYRHHAAVVAGCRALIQAREGAPS